MLRRAVGTFGRPPSRLPAPSFRLTLSPSATRLGSTLASSSRLTYSGRSDLYPSLITPSRYARPLHPRNAQQQLLLKYNSVIVRAFHASQPRRDVFFVAFPALKGYLLELTRYCTRELSQKATDDQNMEEVSALESRSASNSGNSVLHSKAAKQLIASAEHIWRLLMMSKREEMEWARARFTECLLDDGPHLLREGDPRVEQVRRVAERLFTVIEDGVFDADHVVSSPGWPPRSEEPQLAQLQTPGGPWSTGRRVHVTPASFGKMQAQLLYPPSATAESTFMPFRPETSNPTKVIDDQSWKLYVVDLVSEISHASAPVLIIVHWQPKINAFALPTREIFVYTGLVDLLEDDTLLSGVLSHEIAHVTQRHAVENVSTKWIYEGHAAEVLTVPSLTDGIGTILNLMNNYVADRAYSRKLESEADAVGLEFMARAGYDPRYALDLWEVMAAVEEDAAAAGQAVSVSDTFPFLRTHPSSLQRRKHALQDLEKLMPKAMELFAQSSLRSRPKETQVETRKDEQRDELSMMSKEHESETATA
ncbi:peptidase family m48 domain-containing protein [Rhizoctonia solani AG-1 IA]|uniref:Peptidase family m48 domain-containing protein n=1 Tax=Thanatephorus cucumeris (strain AG1-IA) TaxID=983506 RepID=L8X0I8_THACA|nr:peptidase family m48 domain-containing protein [Rhizoctonia solani AG-1 IA]